MLSLAISAVVFVMGSSYAIAAPMCVDPAIRTAAVVDRIDATGSLQLHGGSVAHLEGIRLPLGAADHASDSFRRQALLDLSALTHNRSLTLAGIPPIEDRYGRIRSQVFAGGDWIQAELLEQGLARVSIAPDRADCAARLYAAESRARAARAGLWSSSAYAIRTARDIERDLGTFQIVEGRVTSVSERDGHAWLRFGDVSGADFAAYVSEDDLRTFHAMGVDPRGYQNREIRVRGIIENLQGPAIAVANPMQIEVIS